MRRRAQTIADVIRDRLMPPWLPEPGFGEFAGERRLPDDEIAVIQRWVEQGAVEGDPAARPRVPAWPDGWQLGEPDLIVKVPEPYTLPPDRADIFRNFVIPMPVARTRYVRGIEFRADNPRVLHHAAIGVDTSGASRRLDRDDPEPGFGSMPEDEVKVFGWSPGKAPFLEPEGRAWPLEAGSDLVLEMHLLPSGKPEVVQPAIGFFFTDTPPSRFPTLIKLQSKTIDIPAGAADYKTTDTYLLPADVEVQSIYPHAHYLAKDIKGFATLPDGTMKWLIWIKAWNFKWQDQYRYAVPLSLPKGTTLTMQFTFDNSNDNVRNPHHPPERVMNGPKSSDEMAVLWLEVLPHDPEARMALSRDYVQRELRADIAGAQMRVEHNPADASAHTFLATKYLQAGQLEPAMAQLERALHIDPNDAEAHSNLGTALQLAGRLDEATKHLRQALRLKPADARVHFNMGNAMLASQKLEEAIAEFRRAVRLDPEDADAHYNLASVLGSQNKLDQAIDHLRRVLEINPRRADAHHNLGVALAEKGQLTEALNHAREALQLRKDPEGAQSDRTLIQELENRQR